MKKIKQYLPFILWSISTIILSVVGLVLLPVLILREALHNLLSKNKVNPKVRTQHHLSKEDSPQDQYIGRINKRVS